jgi:hypothetical protein
MIFQDLTPIIADHIPSRLNENSPLVVGACGRKGDGARFLKETKGSHWFNPLRLRSRLQSDTFEHTPPSGVTIWKRSWDRLTTPSFFLAFCI